MSTPITQAHYDLRRQVLFSAPDDGAQLIADSEARAVEPWRTQVEELRGALALGQENCDDVFDDLREERDQAIARAERAEAELANIRALANRRNKQDHSHDTTHQLVVSLDQSLDIVQAELVEERWLKGCAIKRSQELLSELAAERARLDWLMAGGVCMMQAPGGFYISRLHAHVSRAIVDAAMKEGAK